MDIGMEMTSMFCGDALNLPQPADFGHMKTQFHSDRHCRSQLRG
jgi:hypothetical protein